MVYGFLSFDRFAGCDGTLYRWVATPAPGADMYVGMLNKPSSAQAIAAALTDAAGMESRFEAVMPSADNKPADGEESLLAALGETFDKANIIVQDDVK